MQPHVRSALKIKSAAFLPAVIARVILLEQLIIIYIVVIVQYCVLSR